MEPQIRIDRLPGAGVIAPILWLILLAGMVAVLAVHWWGLLPMPTASAEQKVTLSLLRSEAIKFLVVRRAATQIVVEHEQEDWLGHWQGALWATVLFHHGIDLDKTREPDIRREGDTVIVKLPEPELLSFSIEPGSIRCLTKSTAAAKISDILHNGHRKLLEEHLRTCALEFAKGHDLMPTKTQIVNQLNEAAALFRNAGVNIRFE